MLSAAHAIVSYLQQYHDAFGLLAIVFGGLWALLEFRLRRIAERKSLAGQLFEKFKNHPQTILATKMLDWQREFCLGKNSKGKEMRFESSSSNLMKALRAKGDDSNFSDAEGRVRDIFDDFLTELEMLNSYIKSRSVMFEDISPFLSYWVDMMRNGKGIHGQPVSDQLENYYISYDYVGVNELLSKFERRRPSSQPSTRNDNEPSGGGH